MNEPVESENNRGDDDADKTREANGPEQTPGIEGLGAAGATNDSDESTDNDSADTRMGNGPEQTEQTEGLGSGGSSE